MAKRNSLDLPLTARDDFLTLTEEEEETYYQREFGVSSAATISLPSSCPIVNSNVQARSSACEPPKLRNLHLHSHWPITDFANRILLLANDLSPPVHPNDHNETFDLSGSVNDSTGKLYCGKGEAVAEIKNVLSSHNCTKKCIDAVFAALHKTTNLNLPVKVNPRTGGLIHYWQNYLEHDKRNLAIDVCPSFCCAYVNDKRELLRCPTCNLYRFTPCTLKNKHCINSVGAQCINTHNNFADCDPFVSTHDKRSPYKTIYYRPIILKLLDLYKRSIKDMPDMFKYNNTRVKKDGFITDILDGSVVKDEINEMHLIFLDKAAQYAFDNNGAILHECSLCLSGFYDGDKLYDRSDDSMWPLFISVMNADPCFRTKLGLALFLVILHNLPLGCGAERSIIDEMLTGELEQLENGIVFEFPVDGVNHAVLLQARLLFLHLDTRAQDKVLHVSSAGGIAGCTFCGKCHGLTRPIIGTRVYPGSALFLPENHVLKQIGEIKEYKKGYYGEDGVEVNKTLGKEFSIIARRTKISGRGGDADNSEFNDIDGNHVTDNQANKTTGHKSSMFHKRSKELPEKSVWFSTKFPWSKFAKACWLTYNVPSSEKFGRVSHEEYVRKSKRADAIKEAYLTKKRSQNKPIAKNAESDWVYEGVHHGIARYAQLKNPRFHNCCPDAMHAFANAAQYDLQLLTGDRGDGINSRKLDVSMSRFPFLSDFGSPIPWLASTASQCLADTVFKCLGIPTQYKGDYSYDLPFHHSGYMNSHQKIVFFACFAPYILSFTDITSEYRSYFERNAYDLCEMLNPILEADNLPALCDHVIETRALREAMTPSSEHPIIFHQQLEIVHHLEKFGILKSLMCFFGERSMKAIANGVPEGGMNYVKTVNERYIAKENDFNTNYSSYRENVELFLTNEKRFSPTVLKLHGSFVEMSLNDTIKDVLFDDIVSFLTTQEVEPLIVKSSFMRIYFTYRTMCRFDEHLSKRHRHLAEFPSFACWLRELYTIYRTSNVFSIDRVKHLICNISYDGIEQWTTADFEKECAENMVNHGIVYIEDFSGIIADLAQFGFADEQPLLIYTRATIKGVEFRGRGQLYTENEFAVEDFSGTNAVGIRKARQLLQNSKNVLSHNWFYAYQLNSWAEVEDWYIANPDRPEKRQVRSRILYGQFNHFFRLYMPNDKMLHKLAMGNMVLRDCTLDTLRGDHYFVNVDDSSYFARKQFVCLNYVQSTSIAVSALDVQNFPLVNPKSVMREQQNVIKSYELKFSKRPAHDAKRLYMIRLHPERIRIKYGTVEEDVDLTKSLEIVAEMKMLEKARRLER